MENLNRQERIRFKLKKVTNRKRLTIFKSNNHIYAQIINDEKGTTLASVSSLDKNYKGKKIDKKKLAEELGKDIAKKSIDNGIKEVVFDKGKYKYHGIIKIFADSARSGGLIFLSRKICLKMKIKNLLNIWLL